MFHILFGEYNCNLLLTVSSPVCTSIEAEFKLPGKKCLSFNAESNFIINEVSDDILENSPNILS